MWSALHLEDGTHTHGIDVFTNRSGGKAASARIWRAVAAAYLR